MTHSNQSPERLQKLGLSLYAFNFDIQEVVDAETGAISYEYKSIVFDHAPNYDEVINAAIKESYPYGADEAAIRKGVVNSTDAEFVAFNAFVDGLKTKIRVAFNEEF